MAQLVLLLVSLTLTVALYALNRKPRAMVDSAVLPLKVPERRLTYSAEDLMTFRAAALNGPGNALELYRGKVLSIDIGFALSLALAGAMIWQLSAELETPDWLVVTGTVMSGLYGFFDVAEDLALKGLLNRNRISPAAAAAATGFTLGKLVTITLSLAGALIFLLLSVLLRPPKTLS